MVRNYAPYSAEEYISNNIIFPKLLQLDLEKDAKNLLNRVFKYLSSNYPDDLYDAQKLYNYVRARNLNARSYIEAFLCNMITISPLMDPMLLKLDLTNYSVEDRDILHAILLNRFLPELENIPFEGGRNIAHTTINKAKYINGQFNRSLYIGQQAKKEEYVRNQFMILDKADNLDSCTFAKEKHNPTDYILNIYKSEDCEDYISDKFNYQLYRYGIIHHRHNKYIPERFVTKIVFIYLLSKIIDDREIFPKYVLNKYSSTGVVFDLVRLLSTSRFDVINEGNGNTLDVVSSNDLNLVCETPRWFSNSKGCGKSFYTLKNDFNMTIKANGSGKITFIFLSLPYSLANGKHFNNILDYANIAITDAKTGMILNQCESAFGICHDNNKTLSCEVSDQQLLNLHFFFKPHDYDENEIQDLVKQFYNDYFIVSF